jgi:hypothetical protein
MDRPLEAAGQTTVTTGWAEARIQRLEVSEDTPKQLFHHVAVAVLIRVRERVAAWCDRTTNRSKFGSVVAKAVTNIVQANRMSQVRRDEFTKLMQCAAVVLGRRY